MFITRPPRPHTPEVLTVAQLWGHLQEVIVLQVQRSQILHPLQLHGVDGSHLVVAEQDGLQGWEVIKDTGEHLKSSGREKRDSQKQGFKTGALPGSPQLFEVAPCSHITGKLCQIQPSSFYYCIKL